ncbi:hypothetical protein KP509_37G070500 [Ceratopteris richardii]|uniref:Peroxiredoxin-like 2A n=1 Tax=Ceratopteris richardii TaxID=49495 RepID=A0A8T2QA35_CERRI|nr:hypothetical protein KP509_37G070500 [Ceratopteris richardii]
MASFSVEDFVGKGALRELIPVLAQEGWEDVPTLKMMNNEDMDALNFSQRQRVALELRAYLHDRVLMQYADKLEDSGKNLAELLSLSPASLNVEFGMRRGHVAKFIDRASASAIVMPPSLTPVPVNLRCRRSSFSASEESSLHVPSASLQSSFRGKGLSEGGESLLLAQVGSGGSFKGVVAALPAPPRFCGLIAPPPIPDDVVPLSVLDKIFVQKLTPEYRPGMDPWSLGWLKIPPPMKICDIWSSKPTVVLCIRRPGCVMCRAEAHQIYSRKPIFDAMGMQLVVILNELIESEVKSFWPRFWGGMMLVDKDRNLFKALGGGRLINEGFVTGFLCNPVTRANFKRAKATGIHNNLTGGHLVKGGLLVVRKGRGGVAYQFVERNFGDWAPVEEVVEVSSKVQSQNL